LEIGKKMKKVLCYILHYVSKINRSSIFLNIMYKLKKKFFHRTFCQMEWESGPGITEREIAAGIFRRTCRLPSKWRQLGEGNWSPAIRGIIAEKQCTASPNRFTLLLVYSRDSYSTHHLFAYTFFIPLLSLCPHWRNAPPFSCYISSISFSLHLFGRAVISPCSFFIPSMFK